MKKIDLKFLLLLLSADAVFIFLHIVYLSADILPSALFTLTMDHGYSETFQYIKEFWIILLMLSLFFRYRAGIYGVFSLLMGYILLDDAFTIHEAVGKMLTLKFNFSSPWGLRQQDIGELLVSGFYGVFFAVIILLVYFRTSRIHRRPAVIFVQLVLLLVFFGIAVDMIHIMLKHTIWSNLVGIVEDGGEMVVMSFMAWYTFQLGENHPRNTP